MKIQELSNQNNHANLYENLGARLIPQEQVALKLVKILIHNSGYSSNVYMFMRRIARALAGGRKHYVLSDAQLFLDRLNESFHTDLTFDEIQHFKAQHMVNGIDSDGILHDTIYLGSPDDLVGAYTESFMSNQSIAVPQYLKEQSYIGMIKTDVSSKASMPISREEELPVDKTEQSLPETEQPKEQEPSEQQPQKRKRGRPRKQSSTISISPAKQQEERELDPDPIPDVQAREINPILVSDLDVPFEGETSGLTAEEFNEEFDVEADDSNKAHGKYKHIHKSFEYKRINTSTLPRGLIVCRNFAEIHKALLESTDKEGKKLFEGAYSTGDDGSVAFDLSRLHILCVRCAHGFNAFLDDMNKLPLCYFVLCDDRDIVKKRKDWKKVLCRCAKQSVIKVIASTLNCSNKTLVERHISYIKLDNCMMDFWQWNPRLRYACLKNSGIERKCPRNSGILTIRKDGSSKYNCRQHGIKANDWEPDLGIYPGDNPTISPAVKEIKEKKEKEKGKSLFD